MDKDPKEQQGEEISNNEQELLDRRGFLLGLKKWSKIVIGGALLGSGLLNAGAEKEAEAAAWANRGGGVAVPGPIARVAVAQLWSDLAAVAVPGPTERVVVVPGPIAELPGPIAAALG